VHVWRIGGVVASRHHVPALKEHAEIDAVVIATGEVSQREKSPAKREAKRDPP
jgi:hypothetical protein